MDKGFENPEERDWLFCNVFFIIILYIFIYIDIEIVYPQIRNYAPNMIQKRK